ncbi:HEAT repeat domain-containing protein [Streptomyces sp. NBC_00554]|uniref:HEAT repeat domain-containing protein n=1 Tax=Streptomyces sp. NBC_00554 TaxID=2903661 RepID=UPI00352DB33D|nr:HEAT repeat domain-containing protein [Streptomyces sp. NBC_00554]
MMWRSSQRWGTLSERSARTTELLRRGREALDAIRDRLRHENAAVREGCCRLFDHLVAARLVLAPALRRLTDDPEPRVRMMAAELLGKFAHTEPSATAALEHARLNDSSPAVRKVASWYAPGGTIYRKTAPRGAW